jgi:hypothetical protein
MLHRGFVPNNSLTHLPLSSSVFQTDQCLLFVELNDLAKPLFKACSVHVQSDQGEETNEGNLPGLLL